MKLQIGLPVQLFANTTKGREAFAAIIVDLKEDSIHEEADLMVFTKQSARIYARSVRHKDFKKDGENYWDFLEGEEIYRNKEGKEAFDSYLKMNKEEDMKIETEVEKVVDKHYNPRYYNPVFVEWVTDNFNLTIFGIHELKDDPDGNKGSWSMNELYKKWDKHEYNYYMSRKGKPVLVLRTSESVKTETLPSSDHEKLIKYEKFINTFFSKFDTNGLFKPLDDGLNLAYNILDELVRKGKPIN